MNGSYMRVIPDISRSIYPNTEKRLFASGVDESDVGDDRVR